MLLLDQFYFYQIYFDNTLPIGKMIVKLGGIHSYPDGSVIERRSYHFSYRLSTGRSTG